MTIHENAYISVSADIGCFLAMAKPQDGVETSLRVFSVLVLAAFSYGLHYDRGA